jgi:hypothetical protein
LEEGEFKLRFTQSVSSFEVKLMGVFCYFDGFLKEGQDIAYGAPLRQSPRYSDAHTHNRKYVNFDDRVKTAMSATLTWK